MPTVRKPLKATRQDIAITFKLEKETKNTYRYTEASDEPVIGTLYIQKSALGDKAPATLTVTITV